MDFLAKIKTQLIAGGIILALLVGFYFYRENVTSEIKKLNEANGALSTVVTTQTATIDTLNKNLVDSQKRLDTLNKAYGLLENQAATLKIKFDLSKVDKTQAPTIQQQFNENFNSILKNLNLETQVTSFGSDK